jgi:two-component system OmpR family sensor kinase
VFNSIFRKLVTVLLLFGLLMSMIFVIIMRYSHTIYHQEAQQKFHVEVASQFAVLAGWTPSGWADPHAVSTVFANLVTANQQFRVFILDRDGIVLSHYPDNFSLGSNHVSLTPIRKILQPKMHLPILGDDPATKNGQQIFSATQLYGDSRPEKYLYVTLHNEEDGEAANGLRLAYLTREGMWLIFACLTLALAGGSLSLNFIVRPLNQLASTMDGFREDHFKADLTGQLEPFSSGDEIDVLSATFYRMAQQMQVQMRLIEQSDSSRREFFANVSHDLRTPLASIQGYLETLSIMNDSLASTDRQQYLQIALSQSRSLSHLIDTLFYLAKLDSGQIALQPEQFRIEEVVQDVVQKFALQAQKQNIRLEMDGCDKLPFVCADLGLIERALSNLIDNALRHTLEGGSVRLRMQHIDKKIWVSVIDSSGGISESDLPHIFERFYRGHGVLGNAAVNAGIGLSIVSRIVAMHGETVEAGNALGLGAEFRFSLSVISNKDAPCRREQFPA